LLNDSKPTLTNVQKTGTALSVSDNVCRILLQHVIVFCVIYSSKFVWSLYMNVSGITLIYKKILH